MRLAENSFDPSSTYNLKGFMFWIFSKYGDNVRSFEHPWTTDREWLVCNSIKTAIFNFQSRLEVFAEKVIQKGCPLPNCFGLIDGTHIEGMMSI